MLDTSWFFRMSCLKNSLLVMSPVHTPCDGALPQCGIVWCWEGVPDDMGLGHTVDSENE